MVWFGFDNKRRWRDMDSICERWSLLSEFCGIWRAHLQRDIVISR